MSSNIELQNVRYRESPPPYAATVPGEANTYTNVAFRGSQESIPRVSDRQSVYTIEQAKAPPPEEPQVNESSTDPVPEQDEPPTKFQLQVEKIQTTLSEGYDKHKTMIWRMFYLSLVILYAAYFAKAMHYEFGSEASVRLLWVTCTVVFFAIVYIIKEMFGDNIKEAMQPCMDTLSPHGEKISWITVTCLFTFFIIFVIADSLANDRAYNLVSAVGIIVYISLFFIFSKHPAKVKWRPVVWGLALQFIFGLIILRWDGGLEAFDWLGDRVSEFLAHTDAGSAFVFGAETFEHHYFAFKVIPVVIFFSTAISVLYYLGWMQVIIKWVAWVMQALMGTTAAESLCAAGNIFIGQTESPLMIRPFLSKMTASEIHAVMTGGFATIAGSVLAAFILYDVPANHLLSASVMSAPAALAMSKLFYPETEKSETKAEDVATMEPSTDRNVIEAASNGASAAIGLAANIAVNLIAFIAILHFIDATLTWFGLRVGIDDPPLTFELICSYVLWPFAFVMGVESEDCRKVAELIGIKTFLNEFLAYVDLGVLIDNTEDYHKHVANNGTCTYHKDDIFLVEKNQTLVDGILSERSIVISTYALCGFSNISSIGVQIGALGVMAPNKKSLLAKVAVRAMIAGNVACFITACISGLLYQGDTGKPDCPTYMGTIL